MKSIEYILEHYKDFETPLEDRFGRRFTDFLSEEQMQKINFSIRNEYKSAWKPKVWNEENVLDQLRHDVNFGWEKCINGRGISSGLMGDVVRKWCMVLENGLEETPESNYERKLFETVAAKYGWELEDAD